MRNPEDDRAANAHGVVPGTGFATRTDGGLHPSEVTIDHVDRASVTLRARSGDTGYSTATYVSCPGSGFVPFTPGKLIPEETHGGVLAIGEQLNERYSARLKCRVVVRPVQNACGPGENVSGDGRESCRRPAFPSSRRNPRLVESTLRPVRGADRKAVPGDGRGLPIRSVVPMRRHEVNDNGIPCIRRRRMADSLMSRSTA
ncbi:hypothetical protein [Amycolatopsis sp. NBC_00438]|uniref:hypothetical protein n=1 Tax=Amycolatopsis sp. NBC_00438 TaxID=2903558 RepID=UPI002E1E8CF9